MKQIIFIAIISFTFNNCAQNKEQDTKILRAFLDEIVLSDNYTEKELSKYFHLKDDKEKMIPLITHQVQNLEDICKKSNHEIIAHNNLSKNNLSSALIYDNYDHVYYLIVNKEIVAPLIIKEGKLISIAFALYKTEFQKQKHPLIID